MQTLQAIIMGTFQGLTEFLPVSSSGHIVIVSALYKFFAHESIDVVASEEIFFDILIHLSTLFAILIYFYKDIKKIVAGFLVSLFRKNFESEEFKFGLYVMVSTFITCVMAVLINDIAYELTENPFIVSIFLIFTGLVLFLSEKFKAKKEKLNLKSSLLIGFFQGLAIFPGVSRSGMTIASAIFKGIERTEAARFSFILSIPIIIIASVIYPVITFDFSEVRSFNFPAIIFGMLTAFVVGYLCIKYFMKFLEKNNLKIFSYYCFILGLICTIIFAFI